MTDPILDKLDEIEGYSDLSVKFNNQVIKLMDKLNQKQGGLDLLIERYSGSEIMHFPRNIAYLIARRADDQDPNASRLIARFLEKLGPKNETETLTNTLTTLQFLSRFDGPSPWDEPPSALVPFLTRCLSNTGGIEPETHKHALSVIHRLVILGWLTACLTDESATALRNRLTELWSLETSLSVQEILDIIEFLDMYLTRFSDFSDSRAPHI
jgi:hypothetical protein